MNNVATLVQHRYLGYKQKPSKIFGNPIMPRKVLPALQKIQNPVDIKFIFLLVGCVLSCRFGQCFC